MARYKYIDTNPRFLAVDLDAQLPPGTLEHALDHLLGQAIDLSHFDARYRNDETGAPAYPPAMLLQVVLAVCHAQGLIGREMFAIDGVKLPSHASSGWNAMPPRCATGSPLIPTSDAERRAPFGRATGPTMRVPTWPRARA